MRMRYEMRELFVTVAAACLFEPDLAQEEAQDRESLIRPLSQPGFE
jgi:hypothetical protein